MLYLSTNFAFQMQPSLRTSAMQYIILCNGNVPKIRQVFQNKAFTFHFTLHITAVSLLHSLISADVPVGAIKVFHFLP